MPVQNQTGIRPLETADDFDETRIEAVGFIFHGPPPGARRRPSSANSLLHFARCARLERINDEDSKIWFRTVRVAHEHLNEAVGENRWRWCKFCQREITQRILDER